MFAEILSMWSCKPFCHTRLKYMLAPNPSPLTQQLVSKKLSLVLLPPLSIFKSRKRKALIILKPWAISIFIQYILLNI